MKKRVEVSKYNVYGSITKNAPYDGDTIVSLIRWLTELLDNDVPAAYRDRAKLEIDTTPDYDGCITEACIYYDREETVEEAAQRKLNEKNRIASERVWAQQRLAAAEKALKELE